MPAANGGRGTYLQSDEMFKDLNATKVPWVLLDVGVSKERLQRMKAGWQMGNILTTLSSNTDARKFP